MTTSLNKNYKNLSVKREVFYLALILCIAQMTGQAQAVLKFKDSKKSFGFVKKGETVTINYEFTNTGNQSLIITDNLSSINELCQTRC